MTIDEMLDACKAIQEARKLLDQTKDMKTPIYRAVCDTCGKTFDILVPATRGTCTRCKIEAKMRVDARDALNVYLAMVSWDGQISPNIEITILAITKQSAGDKVREILDDGGYDTDDVNFRMYLTEVMGPFKAGFVIARHG